VGTPLALRADWILERYLGWHVRFAADQVKLLERRRGVLRQTLLVACGPDHGQLDALARAHRLVGATTLSTVVDLRPGDGPELLRLADRPFLRADRERFFGVGTFVLDLREDEAVLFGRISTRERSKCRQAERNGVRVACTAKPSAAEIDALLALYAPMAQDRRLPLPQREQLLTMASRGELLSAVCLDSTGRALVANLAFCAHGEAYFLHGAKVADAPAGAGILAQWELMRALKARGLVAYDLGLVATCDEADGLFRFKRSLGGSFVPYGPEYRHTPAWLRPAYALWRRRRFAEARRG